jgi:hypothetical protein
LWEKEEHEENLIIAQVRVVCETLRMQTFHLLNQQQPKNKKLGPHYLKKLMNFKWEKVEKEPQTFEEMKAIMKAVAKGWRGKKTKKGKDNGKDRKRQRRIS